MGPCIGGRAGEGGVWGNRAARGSGKKAVKSGV